jgi:hypothetical protein
MRFIFALLTITCAQFASAEAFDGRQCREVCRDSSPDEAQMQIVRLRRACFTITKAFPIHYGSKMRVCFDGCSLDCKVPLETPTSNSL